MVSQLLGLMAIKNSSPAINPRVARLDDRIWLRVSFVALFMEGEFGVIKRFSYGRLTSQFSRVDDTEEQSGGDVVFRAAFFLCTRTINTLVNWTPHSNNERLPLLKGLLLSLASLS